MTCTVVNLPGGSGAAIVCGRGLKPKVCSCGHAATLLCDGKIGRKNCNAPLCGSCTVSPTPGKDFCQRCAPRESIECPYCLAQVKRITGKEMYPNRPDLASKQFYRCTPCDASVGCHPDGKPYGRMANKQLRTARSYVHGLFDPLWQKVSEAYDGEDSPSLRGVARSRAYAWLADQMHIDVADCHVGMFNIDQCRQAYRILRDSKPTPASIRAWAKWKKEQARA